MDSFQRMLAEEERKGHDMSVAKMRYAQHLETKAAPTPSPRAPEAVSATEAVPSVDDVATVIDAVVARVEVLEASNADLEARLQAVEATLVKFARPRAVA